MAPYYDRAEMAIGSTHRHGRPPLPANNNYKVFANGAEKIGYKFYATGPYGTNAEPYDGRPASIQDGFNFQGDKHTSKWSTAVREIPRAVATGKCDLRTEARRCRSCTTRAAGPTRCSTSTGTATCTGRPRRSSAWPGTRSSRHGCC